MTHPPVYFLLGTRAQTIKMAPLIREFIQRKTAYSLILTGQHKETIDDLLEEFEIQQNKTTIYDGPEVSGLIRMFCWLPYITAKLIICRKKLFPNKKGIVVVHGDTVSTLAGALAGRFLKMRVAHVESGLRSFNYMHPFPEELIRVTVFRLCDVAFCPGDYAVANLNGYKCKAIDTHGNTIIDTVRITISRETESFANHRSYGVVSIHRFENIFFRKRLSNIVEKIVDASKKIHIIFVLHPATKRRLEKYKLFDRLASNKNIELLPRMEYGKFIRLAIHSKFVVTDGGSNQEELSLTNIPVLLMRKATERADGLKDNVHLGEYDDQRFERFINFALVKSEALKINIGTDSPSAHIASELIEMCRATC